jgi:dipeptidase
MVLSLLGFGVPVFADNGWTPAASGGCTDIMVGKDATVDGSTIGTYSCDGALWASIEVVPGETFPPGTMMPIYYRPYVESYEDYLEWLDKPTLKGEVPQVEETYRYVSIKVWYDEQRCGGINEYGLTTGETTISGREELMNENGLLYTYSNYKESSLLTIALQRAETAREAIQIMGSLAEEYGYAQFGEHVTVTDGNEVWAFEIFGPGPDWTLGSGEPGAVWCAQRIPDDEVGVSANRSRIGEVDLDDTDYFMASPNIFSLAEEMGWWDPAEPFIWYEAYGPSSEPMSSLREWEVLDSVAPSLNLDPEAERYPFSVKPDKPVSVQDMMSIYRYGYEGTDWDVTEDPAFYVDGQKSPLACPWGFDDLHQLLGVEAHPSVGYVNNLWPSVFCYVSQVRADLPDPIRGCMWFGFGPASSTCYVPIYSGVTELPESWVYTDLTQPTNRECSWWAFNLINNLSVIKYQETIEDIKGVRDPAEAEFFAMQPDIETAAADLYESEGPAAAQESVTNYTNSCMNAVSDAYWDLVDYMLYKYYFNPGWASPQALPVVTLAKEKAAPPVTKPINGGVIAGATVGVVVLGLLTFFVVRRRLY